MPFEPTKPAKRNCRTIKASMLTAAHPFHMPTPHHLSSTAVNLATGLCLCISWIMTGLAFAEIPPPPDNDGPLASNNRHYITDRFEFFAEEPFFIQTEVPDAKDPKDEPVKKFVPRPLGSGRHKILLFPGVYLKKGDVEVYEKDSGKPLSTIKQELHESIMKLIKLTAPAEKGMVSSKFLAASGTVELTVEQQRKYREAMEAELEKLPRKFDAWFFFTLKPKVLTQQDKREIIAHLTNLKTDEPIIDSIVAAYTFEDVALSDLAVKFELGDHPLGEKKFTGTVSSNSSYVIHAVDLDYKKLKQLNLGLFSADIECTVDLSRVAENSFLFDYSTFESAFLDHHFMRVLEINSKSKRRLFKSTTQTSVTESVREQQSSGGSSVSSSSASFYSRDSSLDAAAMEALWGNLFPIKTVTLAELIGEHKKMGMSADAGVTEPQKALHQAYATYLSEFQSSKDAQQQQAAEDKLGVALSKLAGGGGGGSGPEKKMEVAKATWQFLKTGFATSGLSGSQTFEARFLQDEEFFEGKSGLLSVTSASTVARKLRIVRADFRSEMRGASLSKQSEGGIPAIPMKHGKPNPFDPGWVDPLDPLDKLSPGALFLEPSKTE